MLKMVLVDEALFLKDRCCRNMYLQKEVEYYVVLIEEMVEMRIPFQRAANVFLDVPSDLIQILHSH